MDLAFTPEEERFRAELRTWLGAHLPAGWRGHRAFATLADEVAFLRDWQRTLAGDRWVGIHWPREYGGRGASLMEQLVWFDGWRRKTGSEDLLAELRHPPMDAGTQLPAR